MLKVMLMPKTTRINLRVLDPLIVMAIIWNTILSLMKAMLRTKKRLFRYDVCFAVPPGVQSAN